MKILIQIISEIYDFYLKINLFNSSHWTSCFTAVVCRLPLNTPCRRWPMARKTQASLAEMPMCVPNYIVESHRWKHKYILSMEEYNLCLHLCQLNVSSFHLIYLIHLISLFSYSFKELSCDSYFGHTEPPVNVLVHREKKNTSTMFSTIFNWKKIIASPILLSC